MSYTQPMTLQKMIDALNNRVDDVVDVPTAVDWFNAGKNKMAQAVNADFPDLAASDMNGSYPFDPIYHEAPVLYACARFKEQDSALSEAANFMTQFEDMKKEFAEKYKVPPRYRNDDLSQQFTATAGQMTFTITKESYNPDYGNLIVYVNDVRTTNFRVNSDGTFDVYDTLNDGDAVTAVWEVHQDYVQPPFEWWDF